MKSWWWRPILVLGYVVLSECELRRNFEVTYSAHHGIAFEAGGSPYYTVIHGTTPCYTVLHHATRVRHIIVPTPPFYGSIISHPKVSGTTFLAASFSHANLGPPSCHHLSRMPTFEIPQPYHHVVNPRTGTRTRHYLLACHSRNCHPRRAHRGEARQPSKVAEGPSIRDGVPTKEPSVPHPVLREWW